MLSLARCVKPIQWPKKRSYSGCGPIKKRECGCQLSPECSPIVRHRDCSPTRIQPNPCCPQPFRGDNHGRKFKMLFFFVAVPLILLQFYNVIGHHMPDKKDCREYEYMLRRTHRFPWGDGVKSLFHNDRVNHLPGECIPPEPDDCKDD